MEVRGIVGGGSVGARVFDFAAAREARAAREESLSEPWRSKKYVASHFGVSTKTIERYMKAGMPFSKPLANGWPRFKVSECEAWLRGRGPASVT